MSYLTRCSLIAWVALACACSGDDDGDDGSTYNCEADDRDEAFAAGMTKTGPKGLTFVLVSSTPAPPARGDNAWVVAVKNGDTPIAGAAVEVVPFMPDHRHGTPIDPVVTPNATSGQYDVTPVNLWMPGLWEITVKATPTGAEQDAVVFRFCITG